MVLNGCQAAGGETAQLTKRAILHFISQSVCICVHAILPVCVSMCKCVRLILARGRVSLLAAPLGHVRKSSRDAGKYSRSTAGRMKSL